MTWVIKASLIVLKEISNQGNLMDTKAATWSTFQDFLVMEVVDSERVAFPHRRRAWSGQKFIRLRPNAAGNERLGLA